MNKTVWWKWLLLFAAGFLLFMISYGIISIPAALDEEFRMPLWLPIGIHWAWNFFQGPVFGHAVSGNGTQSLIKPVIEGSDWLTGGSFGAEASVPAVVLGLAFAVVFLVVWKKRQAD